MAKMIIEVELDQDATQMADLFNKSTTAPKEAALGLAMLFEDIASGAKNGVINVKIGAVAASKAGTFTGAPTATETVTINGVAFTARASGATGNEFNIGGTVTLTASALKDAINASTTAGIKDVIRAESSAGVVTIYSKQAGKVGDAIVIADGLSNFTWAGGATKLSGGTQDTNVTYSFGKVATVSY